MKEENTYVSVIMLAYNHEHYIHEAIESVINQKFDKKFELLIGEDCSTDNTLGVINSYQKKYPDLIRVIKRNQNVGMHQNFLELLDFAEGKYLCFCEGDDYWIDENKLQIQTDFLDRNQEYILLCGNARRFNHSAGEFRGEIPIYSKERDIDFAKLARYNCITTATVMIRNCIGSNDFNPNFLTIISADWFMYMLLYKKGKFRYMDHKFSVYRENEGSINGKAKRIQIENHEMNFLNLLYNEGIISLNNNEKRTVKNSIAYKLNGFAKAYANSGDRTRALRLSFESFVKRKFSSESLYRLFETMLFIVFPGVHRKLKSYKLS